MNRMASEKQLVPQIKEENGSEVRSNQNEGLINNFINDENPGGGHTDRIPSDNLGGFSQQA